MNGALEPKRHRSSPENQPDEEKTAERLAAAEPATRPDEVFELSGDDLMADIDSSQAESKKRLDDAERGFGELPLELLRSRREVMSLLDANGDTMRAVVDEARREAEALLPFADTEPALDIASSAHAELGADTSESRSPDQVARGKAEAAMAALVAKGPEGSSYDEKLSIILPALEANPWLGYQLDAVGLSPGEKLGVMLRLAKKSPAAFFTAIKSSGIDFTKDEKMAITQDILEDIPENFPEAARRFNLSHDDVAEIIREYDPENRAVLLQVLKIPGREGTKAYMGFSQEEAAFFMEAEKSVEKRGEFKKIEAVRKVSRDLMLAIEAAFPERAEAERERAKAERELMGNMESFGELSDPAVKATQTANKPLYVNFEGRLLPACYKPRKREAAIRSGIVKGESVGREALAAFIDRALKLDLVPPTVLRDGPEGIGSVQDWKVGQSAFKLAGDAYDQRHEAELKKLAFFDWLTTNSDRHEGNWMVSPDGRHQAIDNGAIFGKRVDREDGLRSVPSDAMAGLDLPSEIRKNVEGLIGSPEVMAALKKGFEATLSAEDAVRAWKEFTDKLELVMADKDFKIQDSEWLDFFSAVRHA